MAQEVVSETEIGKIVRWSPRGFLGSDGQLGKYTNFDDVPTNIGVRKDNTLFCPDHPDVPLEIVHAPTLDHDTYIVCTVPKCRFSIYIGN